VSEQTACARAGGPKGGARGYTPRSVQPERPSRHRTASPTAHQPLTNRRAVDYLNYIEAVFVFDGYANWDAQVRPTQAPDENGGGGGRGGQVPTTGRPWPDPHPHPRPHSHPTPHTLHPPTLNPGPQARTKIRVVCARPYHALFMHNMLIRPTEEELQGFGEPDFVIYNGGTAGGGTVV
jgi:hypothetical protein